MIVDTGDSEGVLKGMRSRQQHAALVRLVNRASDYHAGQQDNYQKDTHAEDNPTMFAHGVLQWMID